MASEPSIIAVIVKSSLVELGKLDADLPKRVLAAMQPGHREALESASRISWLPVAVDVDLTEALFAVVGRGTAMRTLRDTMRDAVSTPLLRPLLQSAVRLHGDDLPRLMQWAPRVWSVVYRRCGQMEVASDGHTAILQLSALPAAICDSQHYLAGTAAAVEGLLVGLGITASARLDGPYPELAEARIRVRWGPGGTPSMPAP